MRLFFNHSLTEHFHIFDALRAKGAVITASCTRQNTPQIHHVDHFFLEPDVDTKTEGGQKQHAQWVIEHAVKSQSSWVIPYRHRLSLAKFSHLFKEQDIRLLNAADHKTLLFVENKPRLLQQMAQEGVPTGDFRIFQTREEFEEALLELDTNDLCVKPAEGIGGIGYRRILQNPCPQNLFGADSMVMGLDTLRNTLDNASFEAPMMLMPYLSGPERSVDVACWKGETLGVVTRTRQKNSQLVGDDPEARNMAMHLVKRFQMSGFVNVQTRHNPTGEQCLLEINTRASGGIGWTLISEINLPQRLLLALEGQRTEGPIWPTTTKEAARSYRFTTV